MTIVMVDSYVIKPDKLGEFMEFGKKFNEWAKKRSDLMKEVKSRKVFGHMVGGKFGGFVEMMEFESLADFEKFWNRGMQDKEFMTTIYPQIASFTVPGSESIEIWNSLM